MRFIAIKCNNNLRCGSLERMWAVDRKQGINKAWPKLWLYYKTKNYNKISDLC